MFYNIEEVKNLFDYNNIEAFNTFMDLAGRKHHSKLSQSKHKTIVLANHIWHMKFDPQYRKDFYREVRFIRSYSRIMTRKTFFNKVKEMQSIPSHIEFNNQRIKELKKQICKQVKLTVVLQNRLRKKIKETLEKYQNARDLMVNNIYRNMLKPSQHKKNNDKNIGLLENRIVILESILINMKHKELNSVYKLFNFYIDNVAKDLLEEPKDSILPQAFKQFFLQKEIFRELEVDIKYKAREVNRLSFVYGQFCSLARQVFAKNLRTVSFDQPIVHNNCIK